LFVCNTDKYVSQQVTLPLTQMPKALWCKALDLDEHRLYFLRSNAPNRRKERLNLH
jgi:hypothetical protein